MKIIGLASAVAVLMMIGFGAVAAPITAGSTISFNGGVQTVGSTTLNMATGLDFISPGQISSPGQPGGLSSYGSGSGVFADVQCAGIGCGTIKDLPSLAIGAQPIAGFVSLFGGNNALPIIFGLTSLSSVDRSSTNFLFLTATGTISYDGYDMTSAQFFLSMQGDMVTSFSASIASVDAPSVDVPEPGTWALLGAAAMAFGLTRRTRAS